MKTAILILVCSIVANAQPTGSDAYKILQPSNDVSILSGIRDKLPRAIDIRAFLVLQNGDTVVVYDTVRDEGDTADFMDNQPHIAFLRKEVVVFDTDSTASVGPVRFHGMATMADSSGHLAAAFAFTLGVDGAETFLVFIGQEGRNYKVTGTLKGAQAQLRFGSQLGQVEFWAAEDQASKNPDEQCVWCRQYYRVTTYLLRPEGLQQLRTSESKQPYSPETFSETPFRVVRSARPDS